MGRLSMSLALVALLAVAGTTYAARPIDVSSESDSIQPMHLLEEHVVADASRDLLQMTYPPPPPLEETQDGSRPAIVQTLSIPFNSSANATDFVNSLGGAPLRLSKGEQYPASYSETPNLWFAAEYLQSALDGASDAAMDGSVEATADGDSVTMTTRIIYAAGTEIDQDAEISNIVASIFGDDGDGAADDTEPNPQPSNRKLLFVTVNLYEDSVKASGGPAEYDTFKTVASDTDNFDVQDPEDDDGAQGLQDSLLMGVAVALAAFLLA